MYMLEGAFEGDDGKWNSRGGLNYGKSVRMKSDEQNEEWWLDVNDVVWMHSGWYCLRYIGCVVFVEYE